MLGLTRWNPFDEVFRRSVISSESSIGSGTTRRRCCIAWGLSSWRSAGNSRGLCASSLNGKRA